MILSLSLNLHFSYDVVLVWASLGSSCFGPLLFLDFYVYFLHQVREISCHYFFKYVFNFLLSLFSFWLPYDVNIGMLKVVLEAPSIIFIFIILFLSAVRIGCFLLLVLLIADLILCFICSSADSL